MKLSRRSLLKAIASLVPLSLLPKEERLYDELSDSDLYGIYSEPRFDVSSLPLPIISSFR